MTEEVEISQEEIRIGVFVCRWGINIASTLDCKKLAEYAKTLPNVVIADDNLSLCTTAGADFIRKYIDDNRLNRVVVGACTPKTHEPVFRAILKDAGLPQSYLEFVNLREQISFVHQKDREGAFEMAKDMIRSGVARAARLEIIPEKVVSITKATMVIGAGVAGIQSALDLADQGIKVYLVEEKPSIGGKMSMLDRTFPTDDCSIWILGPLMLEAQRNKNIEMLTYSEITKVSGYVGNFEVEILRKPRYTLPECNGCGACTEVCPAIASKDFDQGMSPRKAIYIAFAQAVPFKAQIDMKACIQCGNCQTACELNAIDFNQQETQLTLQIGTIIVATGWDEFTPKTGYLGYGLYENVITQLTFERILAPNGPVVGHLVRPSDHQPPKSILFINCVGSRDIKQNKYCSAGVCCMVSIKNAKLAKSHDPEMDVVVAYIDIRAAGKGYEEYYLDARKSGVKFLRSKVGNVREDPKTKNLKVVLEDSLSPENSIKEYEFDLVVLSTSMMPSLTFQKLNKLLGLQVGPDGFLKEYHPRLNTVDTDVPGISLAGACHAPKSISESIMQAKGAASSSDKLLINGEYRISLVRAIVEPAKCGHCSMCANVCPYRAIKIDTENGAIVDEILCRGCGLCAAVCPSSAITIRYYRNEQYFDQINSLFEVPTVDSLSDGTGDSGAQ